MRVGSMIFFFVALSCGTWSFGPNAPYAVGQIYPLYVEIYQYGVFEKVLTFPWRTELPITLGSADPCDGPVAGVNYTGSVVLFPNIGESRNRCNLAEIQALYVPSGCVALFGSDVLGDRQAWGGANPYNRISNDLPIFYSGAQDPAANGYGLSYEFFESGAEVLYFGFLDGGGNTTIVLNYPDANPYMFALHNTGPYQAVIYLSLAWGLFNMLLAAWKLSAFIFVAGRFAFSIPIVVICCMFACSFFVFLTQGIFGGFSNVTQVVPLDVNQFLVMYIPTGFLYSGIIVLGFYFGEVARLTSAQSVPGLDKLLIPAIIWLAITWAILFSSAAVEAADPFQRGGTNFSSLETFFYVMIGVLLPFFSLIPLFWGSFILLKTLKGSGHQSTIIRIAGLTVLLFLLIFSLILLSWTFRFDPEAWVFNTQPGWLTFFNLIYNQDFFYLTGTLACCTLILLNFSVTVEKEIEVSKSGTSSTSSGSSSSSSSSSSKSADPVIEL